MLNHLSCDCQYLFLRMNLLANKLECLIKKFNVQENISFSVGQVLAITQGSVNIRFQDLKYPFRLVLFPLLAGTKVYLVIIFC